MGSTQWCGRPCAAWDGAGDEPEAARRGGGTNLVEDLLISSATSVVTWNGYIPTELAASNRVAWRSPEMVIASRCRSC